MKAIPKDATIGEIYGPAMEIISQYKADEYFRACVQRSVTFYRQTPEEAARIQRINLGYYAGYYDAKTMRRVNKLFRTKHPIFGDSTPTVEETIEAGKKFASEDGETG